MFSEIFQNLMLALIFGATIGMQGFNVDLGEFDNLDLINPRKIWMVVVLITGIDVFGYILGRIVGKKSGFAVTSFMAGFVSSTSATQSLPQRSKYSS